MPRAKSIKFGSYDLPLSFQTAKDKLRWQELPIVNTGVTQSVAIRTDSNTARRKHYDLHVRSEGAPANEWRAFFPAIDEVFRFNKKDFEELAQDKDKANEFLTGQGSDSLFDMATIHTSTDFIARSANLEQFPLYDYLEDQGFLGPDIDHILSAKETVSVCEPADFYDEFQELCYLTLCQVASDTKTTNSVDRFTKLVNLIKKVSREANSYNEGQKTESSEADIINKAAGPRHWTPLMYAAANGNSDLVDYLCEVGASKGVCGVDVANINLKPSSLNASFITAAELAKKYSFNSIAAKLSADLRNFDEKPALELFTVIDRVTRPSSQVYSSQSRLVYPSNFYLLESSDDDWGETEPHKISLSSSFNKEVGLDELFEYRDDVSSNSLSMSEDDIKETLAKRSALADKAKADSLKPGFDNVFGMNVQKAKLTEDFLEIIDDPIAQKRAIKSGTGVVFHGPTGSGKSHLASAFAEELQNRGYKKIQFKLSDVKGQTGMGAGIKVIKQKSEEAIKAGKAVMVIDEADTLVLDRNQKFYAGNDLESEINVCLDELERAIAAGTIVLMTTNHKNNMDPAVTRPGRISHVMNVDYPDTEERQQIIYEGLMSLPEEVHPRAQDEFDWQAICKETEGFSRADLLALANDANRLAYNRVRGKKPEDPDYSNAARVSAFDLLNASKQRKPSFSGLRKAQLDQRS